MDVNQQIPLIFGKFFKLTQMNDFSGAYAVAFHWLSSTCMSQEDIVSTLLLMFNKVLPPMNTMTSLTLSAAVARRAPVSTMKGSWGDVFAGMVEVAYNFNAEVEEFELGSLSKLQTDMWNSVISYIVQFR